MGRAYVLRLASTSSNHPATNEGKGSVASRAGGLTSRAGGYISSIAPQEGDSYSIGGRVVFETVSPTGTRPGSTPAAQPRVPLVEVGGATKEAQQIEAVLAADVVTRSVPHRVGS